MNLLGKHEDHWIFFCFAFYKAGSNLWSKSLTIFLS
jgi:hypothetical protein